jgi:hypothetical protein
MPKKKNEKEKKRTLGSITPFVRRGPAAALKAIGFPEFESPRRKPAKKKKGKR